tara:strand:+ start:366 stop:626 length:261 start_codon:yes stop_codon:yes gene_type:complete
MVIEDPDIREDLEAEEMPMMLLALMLVDVETLLQQLLLKEMMVEPQVPYLNKLVAVEAVQVVLVAMEFLLQKQVVLAELEQIRVPW